MILQLAIFILVSLIMGLERAAIFLLQVELEISMSAVSLYRLMLTMIKVATLDLMLLAILMLIKFLLLASKKVVQ